jgi:pimeloyl-ACP methyl ester carboxylesterase
MSETANDLREPRPAMLLIAGFGDDASMYSSFGNTPLAETYRLLPLNLPGFGAPALEERTSLDALGRVVADAAKAADATVVVAHSVASIIASLAAQLPDCPLNTILSLEGNLTAEDAYFSGTAANYDSPVDFRAAFLERLDKMAADNPVIARYRERVSQADPPALWQLGSDARRFSDRNIPGEVLSKAAQVTYFYNPDNCPEATLRWLDDNPMDRVLLEGASHWPSVDQPHMLAERISETLR